MRVSRSLSLELELGTPSLLLAPALCNFVGVGCFYHPCARYRPVVLAWRSIEVAPAAQTVYAAAGALNVCTSHTMPHASYTVSTAAEGPPSGVIG